MKKIIALLTVVGLVVWLLQPLNPLQSSALDKTIDVQHSNCGFELVNSTTAIIRDYLSAEHFIGVTSGIYQQGCGTVLVAAGFRDKLSVLPFEVDTITRIASITKPMTAVAIMQLYEQGLIELDSPLADYLTVLPKSHQAITIKQLLNHTSGVPHYSSKWDAMSFSHYNSLNEALAEIYQRPLATPPGQQYQYSSFAYTILGKVIEQVSGLSYGDYMAHYIWQPAGMTHTSLETGHTLVNKSSLYIKAGPLYVRSPYTDLSVIYPAGGVQSTAADLLKFGQAIIDNQLISRQTLELMIDAKGSLATLVGDDPYALGWSVNSDTANGTIISHSGAQPGVSAYFQIWLDKKTVAVTLSNAFGTKGSAFAMTNELGQLVVTSQ
ncbi:serine hydrolase [Paraferrimonas sp. SM1919]|uniref:serine hydrolase domain-containing protein n=1 Tax=Paraferrimonas sp. SM1919 TaxID=2662263 RepID=UPI0013D473A5|nr:serine hydrolase domain-containing protein [Paraferrimonas sp. SM1919]